MKLTLQTEVISILMIVVLLIVLLVFANRSLTKFAEDPLQKPTGLTLLCLIAVEMVDGMVYHDVNDEIGEWLGPYIGTLWGYVFFACIWGLTGFAAPTGNYSCTLTLALLTIGMVEFNSIKYNGIKGYVGGLFEPIFVFLPMNIIGKVAPIVSLSMRMFANILSGSIIMSLLYAMLTWVSSMVPVIGQVNFLGPIVAPIFHSYFDLISGLLQTFIFTNLTIIFIGKELPDA